MADTELVRVAWHLLIRSEPVVVMRGHVHCELNDTLGGRYSLGDTPDVKDCNLTLNLLLVDVVDGLVGDGDHALLRPLVHVDLLHHRGVEQRVSADKPHECAVLAKVYVIPLCGEANGCCLNHSEISNFIYLFTLPLKKFEPFPVSVAGLLIETISILFLQGFKAIQYQKRKILIEEVSI